jgi:signal transduction histidine kinase
VNAIQKEIKLENEINEGIFVHADALMLRSILQNLVTNAIKFTPYGGQAIKVTAKPVDNMVEICIQDFGIGMPATKAHQLFSTPNFPSALGTSQEKGTGLGLMLVNDFVLQHGGTIKAESEEGKGTCFRFTMPKV